MNEHVQLRRSLPADFIRDAILLYSGKGDTFLRDLRERPYTIGIYLQRWSQQTFSAAHIVDRLISNNNALLMNEAQLVLEKRRLFERWQAWAQAN